MAPKVRPAATARLDATETVISSLVARVVGTRVPNDASLMEAGIDSLAASEVVSSIGAELTVALPATLLFDSPSIAAICQHVDAQAGPLGTKSSDGARSVQCQDGTSLVSAECKQMT